jgi:uncharacterized protein (UPF0303 family)
MDMTAELTSIERDLEQIAVQEKELQFAGFDTGAAWRVGSHLRDLARSRSLAVVIDIRRFGQPLFYAALEGTSPDNAGWVRRKSNLVARFHRSSYAVGLGLKRQNTNLFDKYGLSETRYAAHGGSFPLAITGAGVIGSITVSGLPQRADHELVVEGLCGELRRDYAKLALSR